MANRRLGKFQKYFGCFDMRKRYDISGQPGPSPLNLSNGCSRMVACCLLGKFQSTSAALIRAKHQSTWRARSFPFPNSMEGRVASRLLDKFQKYFSAPPRMP